MTKNNKNNVELTIKPDKDTEVKINITADCKIKLNT